jgi:lactate 2-monooxygenase
MADNNSQDEQHPPYSQYLLDIYSNGLLRGKLPPVTTNPNLLEEEAKKAMEPDAFNYIFGGAGENSTMDANRLAFRQWKLIPRFLRLTRPRDLRVTLFGHTYG